jgi:hypothetical protein
MFLFLNVLGCLLSCFYISANVTRDSWIGSKILARFLFARADASTDGILRKAELPVVDPDVCRDHLSGAAGFDADLGEGFLCAGGTGDEETCFVSLSDHLRPFL